jgi:hypothetical protein
MVPIVRKEDSSNHSHDHTHDRYHPAGNVGMTTPITPFPRSAPPSTHTTTHTLRISLLGLDRRCLRSSGLDDVTMSRLDRVPSTMPPGCPPCLWRRSGWESTIARPSRLARGLIARRRTQPASPALAAGWAGASFEPLTGCDRADGFDQATTESNSGGRLPEPTWLKPASHRRRRPVWGSRMLAGDRWRDRRGSPSHVITRLVDGYVSFRNARSRPSDSARATPRTARGPCVPRAAAQSLYRCRFAARRRSARLSPWG